MSCSANKTAAVTDFTDGSFASGSSPIEVFEETQSTNNECDCGVTRGYLGATLTFSGSIFPTYVNGTGKIYLKLSGQTDGFSDSGTNTPPVTGSDPAVYRVDSGQTVTLNSTFVSTIYADVTPAFSSSNTCGTDTVLGWQVSDAQVVMTRTVRRVASATFS